MHATGHKVPTGRLTSLLNEAREKLKVAIDAIFQFLMQHGIAGIKKPWIYRRLAHKEYLK